MWRSHSPGALFPLFVKRRPCFIDRSLKEANENWASHRLNPARIFQNAFTQGRTQQISKGGVLKTSIPHSRADPENFGRGDEF